MRLFTAAALVVVACSALTGCATTESSRLLAADVRDNIGKYREGRDRAIESLNASYRTSYLSLMSQYRTINSAALAVGRRTDARAAADEMLLEWQKRSTWTAVSSALEAARTRQLKAMESRAVAIADARRRYAESYAALELELDKLKDAQAKVADLSQKEDGRHRTLELLSRLAKAYQEAQKSDAGTTTP